MHRVSVLAQCFCLIILLAQRYQSSCCWIWTTIQSTLRLMVHPSEVQPFLLTVILIWSSLAQPVLPAGFSPSIISRYAARISRRFLVFRFRYYCLRQEKYPEAPECKITPQPALILSSDQTISLSILLEFQAILPYISIELFLSGNYNFFPVLLL